MSNITDNLDRLVKSKPTESFLIFTYRDRDKVHFAKTILQAMERAGIECAAMDASNNLRINIQTWGRETATNAYSYCQNVVLLGVLFQPQESVAGRYLGQVDNVRCPRLEPELRRLVYSECAHSIYQAINRACMRQVDAIDGVAQAKACNVYLWHRDAHIEERLAPVLQGVPDWMPWREPGESLGAQDVARLLISALTRLERDGVAAVSSRRLKSELASMCANGTWQRARDIALQSCPSWVVDGRSLVRLFPAS